MTQNIPLPPTSAYSPAVAALADQIFGRELHHPAESTALSRELHAALTELLQLRTTLAAVEAHNAQFRVDHSTHDERHCSGLADSWSTRAARDLDAILHPSEDPTTPEALADGTLDLGCGALWAAAELDEWREDHLPGCATCIGTFGLPTNERSI